MMTLSRTVMPLKIVVSWKVRTTPLARHDVRGKAGNALAPEAHLARAVGRRNEEISLNSVDLPAPFGPITERISRSRTENDTSLTATSPPKRFVRPATCRRSVHRFSPSPAPVGGDSGAHSAAPA